MNRTLSVRAIIISAVLAISCGAMTEVRAGTITARQLVAGCGNLNTTTQPTNLIKSFTQLCSMDILFTVMNTGGLNPLAFTENVSNATQATWVDYHIEVGFGTGTQFTPAPANCGVGFTNIPAPTSSRFTPQGVGSNRIDWGGGTVPPATPVTFNFTLNVLDLSPCIPVGSQLANGFVFTLRQTPTIPEPATMLLLGSGLAGIALKMRKRLNRSRQAQRRD